MFARVVIYRLVPGTGDPTIREAERSLLPLFRRLPGFVSYEVIRTGADTAVSVSHWETEADADAAMEAGASWVTGHVADQVLQSAAYVGPVEFFHRADRLVSLG